MLFSWALFFPSFILSLNITVSQRPSLERSNSISESSEDYQAGQTEALSSICENGEAKETSSESENKDTAFTEHERSSKDLLAASSDDKENADLNQV